MSEQNDFQLKSLIGIVFPLLTILAFGGVYYYESGYFNYFGISGEFIEIELSKHYSLIFIILISAVTLSIFGISIPHKINTSIKTEADKHFINKAYRWHSYYLIFTYTCVCIVSFRVKIFFMIPINIAAIISEYLFHHFDTNKFPSNTKITQFLNLYARELGLSIFAITLFLILSETTGYFNAKFISKNFTYKKDKKVVVIRKYSDCIIYGIPDSTNEHLSAFIISKGKSDADTILISK